MYLLNTKSGPQKQQISQKPSRIYWNTHNKYLEKQTLSADQHPAIVLSMYIGQLLNHWLFQDQDPGQHSTQKLVHNVLNLLPDILAS